MCIETVELLNAPHTPLHPPKYFIPSYLIYAKQNSRSPYTFFSLIYVTHARDVVIPEHFHIWQASMCINMQKTTHTEWETESKYFTKIRRLRIWIAVCATYGGSRFYDVRIASRLVEKSLDVFVSNSIVMLLIFIYRSVSFEIKMKISFEKRNTICPLILYCREVC